MSFDNSQLTGGSILDHNNTAEAAKHAQPVPWTLGRTAVVALAQRERPQDLS